MYAETLSNPVLAYLPGHQSALPYLLDHPELVELSPEIKQMYDLARSFIFFEDEGGSAVIVVLDVTPTRNGKGISLRMPDTAETFTSKRLTFNLTPAALSDESLSDSRNALSTNHREWLRWVSAFYDAAPKLQAQADIDLYLIASEKYQAAPKRLTERAYAHLRWHMDDEGMYVVPVR